MATRRKFCLVHKMFAHYKIPRLRACNVLWCDTSVKKYYKVVFITLLQAGTSWDDLKFAETNVETNILYKNIYYCLLKLYWFGIDYINQQFRTIFVINLFMYLLTVCYPNWKEPVMVGVLGGTWHTVFGWIWYRITHISSILGEFSFNIVWKHITLVKFGELCCQIVFLILWH